jgi:hypothetical protein
MDEEDRQERRGDRFRRLLADIADRLIEPVSKGQMYAFYLMAIVAVVIGIMIGIKVTKNAQREARHSEQTIQESRRKTILENCEEQNNRNRNTLAEAETIPGDKHIIVALIDDLAPYHNCQEVLHKAGF